MILYLCSDNRKNWVHSWENSGRILVRNSIPFPFPLGQFAWYALVLMNKGLLGRRDIQESFDPFPIKSKCAFKLPENLYNRMAYTRDSSAKVCTKSQSFLVPLSWALSMLVNLWVSNIGLVVQGLGCPLSFLILIDSLSLQNHQNSSMLLVSMFILYCQRSVKYTTNISRIAKNRVLLAVFLLL